MRKLVTILCLTAVMFTIAPAAMAIAVGTYKTETEYGLLDGFKINWKRKDKSKPFIEPREETTQFEKQKEKRFYDEDEYQRTKYMYDGKAII